MENKQLIQDTLHSLSDFLPKIANSCLSIADLLRSNEERAFFEYIQKFVEALEWSIQAINGIKKLDTSFNINTYEINEFLLEAKNGLEYKDIVLTADMFEYEIKPIIESWVTKVQYYIGETK